MTMKTKFLFSESEYTRKFQAGEIIFQQGEMGDSMYAIIEGEVEIIINDLVVNTVTSQNIFGEMAVIDKQERSATAKAKTDCKLNVMNQKRFIFLVQQNPYFALDIMSVLTQHIRNMNNLLNKGKVYIKIDDL